jgi:hypothetical protein
LAEIKAVRAYLNDKLLHLELQQASMIAELQAVKSEMQVSDSAIVVGVDGRRDILFQI